MTRKNFRDLKVAPNEIVKCFNCGIAVLKKDIEKYRWYVVSDKYYFCPNCDVTVMKNDYK